MSDDMNRLELHDLKPAPGARRDAIRVGRGKGGKGGKTAGRGTKGLKSRSKLRPGFEGGQTPVVMRLPKLRGFTRPDKEVFAIVNVGVLNRFPAGASITPDDLRSRGIVKQRGRVKVLAEGEVDRVLRVEAHAFSEAAREKIEAAGGTCRVVE